MRRNVIKDLYWHSNFVKGCLFSEHDIPICHTRCTEIPKEVISYDEAKEIYSSFKRTNEVDFEYDAIVCFYIDDYKFDSSEGIWFSPKRAYEVLRHFKGIITPDFSTYIDFPDPLKRWNIYRDRAFGVYWNNVDNGKYDIIPNVRGDLTNIEYCFDGIDKNSIVAIGTVGSGLKFLNNRFMFRAWLDEMIKHLNPHTIIVYGSAKYSCFEELKKQGIRIIEFPSKTAKDFERRKQYV